PQAATISAAAAAVAASLAPRRTKITATRSSDRWGLAPTIPPVTRDLAASLRFSARELYSRNHAGHSVISLRHSTVQMRASPHPRPIGARAYYRAAGAATSLPCDALSLRRSVQRWPTESRRPRGRRSPPAPSAGTAGGCH